MATRTWTGNAASTYDVWTGTVANTWATGDTATITINGKTMTITVGTLVTTAQVATTISQAFNGTAFTDTTASVSPTIGSDSLPEFEELTATVSGSVVTFTADTAGVPHTLSMGETTAGDGTFTGAHATTATGPNYWTDTDNWAEGSVPTTGDDVVIDRPISILYGLDNNGDTLASMTISELFTSSAYIGLPFRNSNGYEEYREDYLKVSITTLNCFAKSGRIKINVGTAQTTVNVYGTGATVETDRMALQLLGTHASNVVNFYAGSAGIASNRGEASTVATLRQTNGTLVCGDSATLTTVVKTAGTLTVASSTTSLLNEAGTLAIRGGTQTALTIIDGTGALTGATAVTTLRQSGGTVTSGPNVTFTTIDKDGGTLTTASGCTTLTNDGGNVTVTSGNITTLNISTGTFYYKGTGTIGTINVTGQCTLDFRGTTAGCTVTTINDNGHKITKYDPAERVTWTNGYPAGANSVINN